MLQFRIAMRGRMRNSVLSSVSRLYRDCIAIGIPGFGGFHYKTWEFGNPDSGFEFRIAIVSRYDRDMEFILRSGIGWVRNWRLRQCSRHSPAEGGVCSAFLWMFWSPFPWPRASKLSLQTPQSKILLGLLITAVEELECCARWSQQTLAWVISSS